MSRFGWDFWERRVEVVQGVEKGKGRGWCKVYGGKDRRIVQEERDFGGGRRVEKRDLLIGSTWRLISWLIV